MSVLSGRYAESAGVHGHHHTGEPGLHGPRYDASFCRQAAITGNRQWSRINVNPLYTRFVLWVVRRNSSVVSCALEQGTLLKQCALISDPDPELPDRLKAVELVMVSLACRPPTSQQDKGKRPLSAEICRLYNNNHCCFPKCRYRHVCSTCGGGHPTCSCPRGHSRAIDSSCSERGNQALAVHETETLVVLCIIIYCTMLLVYCYT